MRDGIIASMTPLAAAVMPRLRCGKAASTLYRFPKRDSVGLYY